MSSVARIKSSLRGNVKVFDVVSDIDITFHDFGEFQAAASIVFGVFQKLLSIV